MHYGGQACDMDAFERLGREHGLPLVEDAAHAVLARHGRRCLGSIGAVAALSFHETKNLSCGEGGALLVNDLGLLERVEILREKGTDRARMHRGEVDHYEWLEAGSSYLASEISAAVLWAQFDVADRIVDHRRSVWQTYHEAFADLEASGRVRRPAPSERDRHNGHLYYLLARDRRDRDAVIERLRRRGVHAVFHYVPLHSSPAGRRYGRAAGALGRTDDIAARLLRLPLFNDMDGETADRVVGATRAALED
jgi:dTDP-4-amino-4,6-dideoxygalactose transaminase